MTPNRIGQGEPKRKISPLINLKCRSSWPDITNIVLYPVPENSLSKHRNFQVFFELTPLHRIEWEYHEHFWEDLLIACNYFCSGSYCLPDILSPVTSTWSSHSDLPTWASHQYRTDIHCPAGYLFQAVQWPGQKVFLDGTGFTVLAFNPILSTQIRFSAKSHVVETLKPTLRKRENNEPFFQLPLVPFLTSI